MKLDMNFAMLLFCFLNLTSCSKKGNDSNVTDGAPVNLVINSVISQDGSGDVAFTATANNA